MMKSSFKKVDKGANSSQKCFFGHPQLDAVLNNSLSKGHVIVIEEDHPSTHYLALTRCFLSHQYSQDLTSVVFGIDDRWQYLISPLIKKSDKPQTQTSSTKSEIAWRYDKMIIKHSSLLVDERIPLTDLSKEINEPNRSLIQIHHYPNNSLREVYKAIEEAIVTAQNDQKDTTLKKLLLSSLPASLYKDQNFSDFLKAIKCLTRSTHTLTLITVPSIIPAETQKKLVKHADYYMKLGQIGKGYDDFTGTLTLMKEVQVGALRSQFRGPSIWGLKSGKKQLQIEALYQQAVEGEQINKGEHDF